MNRVVPVQRLYPYQAHTSAKLCTDIYIDRLINIIHVVAGEFALKIPFAYIKVALNEHHHACVLNLI